MVYNGGFINSDCYILPNRKVMMRLSLSPIYFLVFALLAGYVSTRTLIGAETTDAI